MTLKGFRFVCVLFKWGSRSPAWERARLRLPSLRSPKVYVDAKIVNMHDVALSREAYVGYVVESTGERKAQKVGERESDDAEVRAILFAIQELKGRLGRFTVVCDHESVVSEANRPQVKNPSALLTELRQVLQSNPSIRLEALKANPAHGVVTAFVNGLKPAPE